MTVKELIEKLQRMPQDVEVSACGDNPPTIEITTVEYIEDFHAGVVFPGDKSKGYPQVLS